MLSILIKNNKKQTKNQKRKENTFGGKRYVAVIVLGVFAYLQSHQILCIEKLYAVFVFMNYMLTKLFKSKLS